MKGALRVPGGVLPTSIAVLSLRPSQGFALCFLLVGAMFLASNASAKESNKKQSQPAASANAKSAPPQAPPTKSTPKPTQDSAAQRPKSPPSPKGKPVNPALSKRPHTYTLPPKQRARLERGEIMVWSQNIKGFDIPRVYAKALLPGSVAKNWKLIRDCRILKRIVPAVERVEVRKSDVNGQTCWLLVDAPWPFSDLTSTLKYSRQSKAGGYAMGFVMVKGDYDRNRGHWSLKPYGDKADRTLLKYWIHSIPHTTAPNSFIKWGTKSNLKTMFKRLIKVSKATK